MNKTKLPKKTIVEITFVSDEYKGTIRQEIRTLGTTRSDVIKIAADIFDMHYHAKNPVEFKTIENECDMQITESQQYSEWDFRCKLKNDKGDSITWVGGAECVKDLISKIEIISCEVIKAIDKIEEEE